MLAAISDQPPQYRAATLKPSAPPSVKRKSSAVSYGKRVFEMGGYQITASTQHANGAGSDGMNGANGVVIAGVSGSTEQTPSTESHVADGTVSSVILAARNAFRVAGIAVMGSARRSANYSVRNNTKNRTGPAARSANEAGANAHVAQQPAFGNVVPGTTAT